MGNSFITEILIIAALKAFFIIQVNAVYADTPLQSRSNQELNKSPPVSRFK